MSNDSKGDKGKGGHKGPRLSYDVHNAAFGQLAIELPQYDIPAMHSLYEGFNVGNDPIIAQCLDHVSLVRQQANAHKEKQENYRQAVAEGREKEVEKPGDFSIDPVLANAMNAFNVAKQNYSDQFVSGYAELTVKDAIEIAGVRDQKFPEKLIPQIKKYATFKISDLKDEGEQGKVRQAMLTLIPQYTHIRMLPKVITRMTEGRLEQIADSE